MTSGKLENIIKYTKNLNVLYVEDNIYVQQQTIKMLESPDFRDNSINQ